MRVVFSINAYVYKARLIVESMKQKKRSDAIKVVIHSFIAFEMVTQQRH